MIGSPDLPSVAILTQDHLFSLPFFLPCLLRPYTFLIHIVLNFHLFHFLQQDEPQGAAVHEVHHGREEKPQGQEGGVAGGDGGGGSSGRGG